MCGQRATILKVKSRCFLLIYLNGVVDQRYLHVMQIKERGSEIIGKAVTCSVQNVMKSASRLVRGGRTVDVLFVI